MYFNSCTMHERKQKSIFIETIAFCFLVKAKMFFSLVEKHGHTKCEHLPGEDATVVTSALLVGCIMGDGRK